MKKILLMTPPHPTKRGRPAYSHPPLGILYIASIIRENFEVKILDSQWNAEVGIKKSDGSFWMGMSYEEIKNEIEKFQPDVVGVSVSFTSQAPNGEDVCRIVKEVNQDIIVVMGGADPTARYKKILANNICDYCVLGEGEFAFNNLLLALKNGESPKGIAGIAYKENEEIIFTRYEKIEDLDSLPLPSYDLMNPNSIYFNTNKRFKKKSFPIVTSRGCPYFCNFCSIHLHMGYKFRSHSVEYVINHIKFLQKNFGTKHIRFMDDNLSYDLERFEKILDGIIESNLNITWDTPNGIRADTLNYDFLVKMKQSGCVLLILAIESGSQRVLDQVIRKDTNLEYNIKIAKFCHELSIPTDAFYIIGFPGETETELKMTVSLALELHRKYKTQPSMFFATPLPGTSLSNLSLRKGLIRDDLIGTDFIQSKPMIKHTVSHIKLRIIYNKFLLRVRLQNILNRLKNYFNSGKLSTYTQ